jgi:oligopeptide/dipeptide ABC transporter ATP-binding protein
VLVAPVRGDADVSGHAPLLGLVDLEVCYRDRRRGAARHARVTAVQGVNLDLLRGEAVGLVGESGSGKSTLARAVMGVAPIEAGRVFFDGADLAALRRQDPLLAARRVQMVYQDALGALDPRQAIGSALIEVLDVHGHQGVPGLRDKALGLLDSVGLGSEYFDRFPHQLSGGQRQRAGIARALAVEPEVLILDEPVSALDVSVQAQILTLLDDLRNQFDLTLLLIAHDLAVVRNVCDRVAVLFRGRIVEEAHAEALFSDPLHPYTRDLLAAVPRIDRFRPLPLETSREAPRREPAVTDDGCPYSTRCRHPNRDQGCGSERPSLVESNGGHAVACSKVD